MAQLKDPIKNIPGITCMRLKPECYPDIARLASIVYGRTVSPGYYMHRYNGSVPGLYNLAFVAYNAEGEPVAFNGMQTCTLEWEGQLIPAAQNTDIMTHPAYRYRGLFANLSQRLFALCRQQGVQLLFGFPNDFSYHGAVHTLNWQPADRMHCFSLSVKRGMGYPLLRKMGWWNAAKKEKTWQAFNAVPGGIENAIHREGFAGVWRNEAYLQWKAAGGSKVIQLEDARVWLKEKHHLMVGDIFNMHAGNAAKVMDGLFSLAKQLGLEQVQFHCSPGTTLYKHWSRLLPATDSYPVLIQDFGSGIPADKLKFSFADIDIF